MEMTPKQAIRHFGSGYALAKAIGIAPQNVYKWKRLNKIPYLRQIQIEKITGGKLRADEVKR